MPDFREDWRFQVSVRPCLSLPATILATLLMAGCGSDAADAPAGPQPDPAITAALFDPIMVDPGLSGQDRNAEVITAIDSARVAVPVMDRGPEAIAAARREAEKRVGGKITPAPAPGEGTAHMALTAEQFAAATGVGGAACARAVAYSARWAAMLPDALGVYPRGAVQEAAGTDQPGCGLRVVHFLTPIPPQDIIDFYYARVRKGGYGATHSADGDTLVLTGRRAKSAYAIEASARADGLTRVDLVVSGG
jgi:hypothetical protein